jgi:hypothetical protein
LVAVAGFALAGLTADTGAVSAPAIASLSAVATANSKSPGIAAPNVLSKELQEAVVAQGSFKLENPDPVVGSYGYDSNGPFVPLPSAPTTEASKTEPDKNTYLVIKAGLAGADTGYSYGAHFLFQGHEGGTTGYLTRQGWLMSWSAGTCAKEEGPEQSRECGVLERPGGAPQHRARVAEQLAASGDGDADGVPLRDDRQPDGHPGGGHERV